MRFPIRIFTAIVLSFVIGAVTAVNGATVTITLQDTNFPTQFNDGGDFFSQGTTELGMWANSGAKQTAAWKNFTTTGTTGGSNRNLQIGDVFTITVSATRAFGQIGFSLNNGGTQGSSYANSLSGSRMYVSTDNYANWSVKGLTNSGTASLSYTPIQSTYKDYRFTVKMTSQSTADVYLTVDGTDYRAYNLTLAGTAGANISAFSIFGSDMWDGDSNDNAYWKQTTTVVDSGSVQVGYYLANGNTFTPGLITDGLNADSTSTTRANIVEVGGDSGSAVILNKANTYTGATTINAAATARAQNAQAFGTTAAGVTVTSGGVIEISGTTAIGAETLTLNGTGISSAGALRNTANNNSWAGLITLGSASRINSDSGTLTLDVASGNAITGTFQLNIGGAGSVTVNDNINISTAKLVKDGTGTLTLGAVMNYTGNTEIDQGTLSIGSGGGLSSSSKVFLGSGLNNLDSTLALAGTTTFANDVQVNASLNSGAGTRTIQKTDATSQTFSGALTNNKASTIDVVANGTLTMSGVISGSGTINKTGSGSLTLSGNTANSSTGAITVSTGTLVLNKSTGTAAIGGNLTINSGATLRTDAANQLNSQYVVIDGAFDMNGNNQTFALAGSGTVTNNAILTNNSTGTDTFSGVISGSGAVVKTNTGTNVFSGNNTYTGGTTVGQGTLRIGAGGTTGSILGNITNNGTVTFNRSDNITYSGIMSGTGSFQKWGAGILTLSGANTINGADHYLLDGTTLFTVSQGAGFGGNLNLGDTIGSAAATLSLTNGISINNPVIVRSGTGTRTIQSLSTSGTNTLSGAVTLNKNATFDSATGGALAVSGVLSGTGLMTKTGLGTVELVGNNSFSGGVIISAGTLSITNANSLGSGDFNFGNGNTLTTLLVNSNTTITSTFRVYNAASNAVVNVVANTTNTISGKLTQDGTDAKTKFGKDGDGTLILNNSTSDFKGQIQVGRGTVILGHNNALGSNASINDRGVDLGLNVGDTVTSTDAAFLASGGVAVSQSIYVAPTNSNSQRTIGLSGSGTATFNNEIRMEAGSSLTVRAGASSTDQVTISGAITGQNGTTQNLIKNEAGTLVLSGPSANTYGGSTTINSGTLRLAKTAGVNAIASGTIAVNSGGTLLLGAANQIGDTADITLSGGTLSTAGNADAVKKLTVSANSTIQGLNSTSGSAFTFSDIDLGNYSTSSGSTLTFLNSSGTSYALGTVIQLSTVAASSWTGFGADRTVALNNFESKISFADANLKAQINFGGGTSGTTLTVAAIPEPKVYVAAGALALLIGYAEVRRRKRASRA